MKIAILFVSFGTTYPGTRQKNITAIREQVQALYLDVLIEEAVSSTIVRKAMRTREDIEAKSPAEGLEALKEKVQQMWLYFPPTSLMELRTTA